MPNSLEVSHLSHRYPPRGREQARDTLHDVSFEAGGRAASVARLARPVAARRHCCALRAGTDRQRHHPHRRARSGDSRRPRRTRRTAALAWCFRTTPVPAPDVAGNVGFWASNKLASRGTRCARAGGAGTARLRDTAHAYPHELFRWQQQRVALACAGAEAQTGAVRRALRTWISKRGSGFPQRCAPAVRGQRKWRCW